MSLQISMLYKLYEKCLYLKNSVKFISPDICVQRRKLSSSKYYTDLVFAYYRDIERIIKPFPFSPDNECSSSKNESAIFVQLLFCTANHNVDRRWSDLILVAQIIEIRDPATRRKSDCISTRTGRSNCRKNCQPRNRGVACSKIHRTLFTIHDDYDRSFPRSPPLVFFLLLRRLFLSFSLVPKPQLYIRT